jgi:hypothetical protein
MGRGDAINRRCGFSAITLTAVTLCLSAAPASAAPPVLDAECLGPHTFLLEPGLNQRVAQTFTAQTSGSVVQGRVEIQKLASGSGDWVMEIFATDNSGTPVNPALATTTIPDAGVPVGDSTLIGHFTAPASVEPGKQYALSVVRSARFFFRARGGDPCPGQVFAIFSGTWSATAPGDDLLFMVLVEPAPPSAPEPQPAGDANPPTATITGRPNDRTSSKQATFTFTGADARAVASFQCSLDGGPFAPCASPHTVSVGRGNHSFYVHAVDDSGNVGAPASDGWKVKKKKKRKRG